MFHKPAFIALLILLAPLLVSCADVTPTEPGGGETFTADKTCHVAWKGNTDPATNWTQMSIELMSGDNFHMNHITTVASNLDGNADGDFNYTCPEMNPYSAIYFYQFSSPNAVAKQWTTRFTIASPTGATTPPANAFQPNSTDAIPWGIGALVDPSKAVAPPPPSLLPPSLVGPAGSGTASGTGTAQGSPANTTSTTGTPGAPSSPITPTDTPSAPVVPNIPASPATSTTVTVTPTNAPAPTDAAGNAPANNGTNTGGQSGGAFSVVHTISGQVYLGAALVFVSFSLW